MAAEADATALAAHRETAARAIDALREAALSVNQPMEPTLPEIGFAAPAPGEDATEILPAPAPTLPPAFAGDFEAAARAVDALSKAAPRGNGPIGAVSPERGDKLPAADEDATDLLLDAAAMAASPAPAPMPPPSPTPAAESAAKRPRRFSLLGGVSADLVAAGLLTERRAVALGLQARECGETFFRVLARELPAPDMEPIYDFLAERLGQKLIRRKNELIERVAEAPWLTMAAAEQRGVLLLRSERADEAPYAALDPCDLLTRDWIGRLSGCRPVPIPVLPDVLLETIGRLRTRVETAGKDKPLVPINIDYEQEQRIRARPEMVDIPTIVDFIVHTAFEQGASDIHVEPVEDSTVVRVRIDGMLHEDCRIPMALHPAITSRIKVLAGMDVAERRRPQDGRISAQIRRMPLDIRVSSSPTVLGEKIVMRLLDEKALRPAPEQLGLRDSMLQLLLDKIAAPHGLVMLSGPTGSGKTTTLYSCLSAIDRQRRNVLTIEDPVEYRLKGVHQMQVNDRIGLTFAAGLRNILRQDPDVIMVGECRDIETAKMAIQASLTGHVVFSTIHANDAVGVITRLIDMQIDPYLVATALALPIDQRLVRSICPHCRTMIDGGEMLGLLRADGISDQKLARLGVHIDPREPCHHAAGCPNCRHTGYAGRQAVFEMFEITEPMSDLIASPDFNADALRALVTTTGAASMVENALTFAEEGVTTFAEIVRVFGDGAG